MSVCQWLNTADVHTYAFDQNIPCGSRVMNISLTANGRPDSHRDYSTHLYKYANPNYQLQQYCKD